jgi:hypothetical protein
VYAAGGGKDVLGVLTFGTYKLSIVRPAGDAAKPAKKPAPAVASPSAGKKAIPGRKKPTT